MYISTLVRRASSFGLHLAEEELKLTNDQHKDVIYT